ncbi:MAG: type II toxin-antitoxin system RelE/ParE family toxin [Rhodothermales bacterium]|nr:type II toxin-antitoxin system RelE/ParE family toxin [Rhodothermales bacterium]
MSTLRWSTQARKDLEVLSDQYRDASPSFAERFEEQMLESTRRLQAFPRSGRMIPEAEDEELREVIYREYRIMYHFDETAQEVLILTILHSSRQFGGFE